MSSTEATQVAENQGSTQDNPGSGSGAGPAQGEDIFWVPVDNLDSNLTVPSGGKPDGKGQAWKRKTGSQSQK
eukprot:4829690-Heterocapsa_arctica.AAC.1